MLVRSRRTAAFAISAALLALAAACTNPTAPAATSNNAARGVSGDGVIIGTGTAPVAPSPTDDGVIIGTGT